MRDQRKRKTVSPVPGEGQSLATLRKILDWLREPRTLAEFSNRCSSLGFKSKVRITFLQNFLEDIGCIVEDGDTLKGQGAFNTDESIIRAFHERCEFVGELLKEVSTSPKTVDDLLDAQKHLGLDVKKYEIVLRRDYLQSAKMLEVKKDGKLHITDKGDEFLASLDDPPTLEPHQSRHFPLNTILYGPPGTGKTYATFRRCVDICDGEDDTRTDAEVRSRYKALAEADPARVEFVTFHQSYGYEEFVEGLRPDPESHHLSLVPVDGVLKRIAERARKRPKLPYVLVIDEINRANVSKVLGELITLLEKDKREGKEVEVAVTLPHSRERFTLPSNLHVLGTMNTADRSIALIDTALRRRFRFEELAPDPARLHPIDGINLKAILETINGRLEYLIDRDHLIGHAWLMKVHTKAELDDVMRDKIIPLIAEYFYDDRKKVVAVLGDGFFEKTMLNRPHGLKDMDDERQSWKTKETFDKGAYDSLASGKD